VQGQSVEIRINPGSGWAVAGLETELFVIRFQFLAGLVFVLHIVALGEQIARLHHMEDGLSAVVDCFVEHPQIEMGFGRPGAQFQCFLKGFNRLGILTPLFVFRCQFKMALRILRFALCFFLALLEFA